MIGEGSQPTSGGQPPVRPEQTTSGQAVSDLTAHVFRLHALLATTGDALAASSGQTMARWRVLSVIDKRPATIPHIAKSWWLTRQAVQRIADLLVADDLASYGDNAKHRRSKLLCITPAGLVALEAIRTAQATWADALGVQLDHDQVVAANDLLRQVTALAERTS